MKKSILYFIICVLVMSLLPSSTNATYLVQEEQVPVILIHGYNDKGATWDNSEFANWLRVEDVPVHIVDYEKYSRNDITSDTIQNIVKKTFKKAGISNGKSDKQVDIVVHSMGGLNIRWFLYENPEYRDNVRKIIFLGTPNKGAKIAFVSRVSEIVDNYQDYGISKGTVKRYQGYYEDYEEFLFSNEVKGKPISFYEWLYQSNSYFFNEMSKHQYIPAGTKEQSAKLYNGDVGVKVEKGGLNHRYSKAFQEFATLKTADFHYQYDKMNEGRPFKVGSKELLKLKMGLNRDELINIKELGNLGQDTTSRNIVMDRLMSERFDIPIGKRKDGSKVYQNYVSNLFLHELNSGEFKYRSDKVFKNQFIPQYITISTQSDNLMVHAGLNFLSKMDIWENPYEVHDDVVTKSSVALKEFLYDKNIFYSSQISHSHQPHQTELIKKYFINPLTAEENNDGYDHLIYFDLKNIIASQQIEQMSGNPLILKNHEDIKGKKVKVIITSDKNQSHLIFAKRDDKLKWNKFERLKMTPKGDTYQYQITLTMDDTNDYFFGLLEGYEKSKNNLTISVIPEEKWDSPEMKEIEQTNNKLSSYYIQPISIEQKRHHITLKFKVKDYEGKSVGLFRQEKDFMIKDNNNLIGGFSAFKVYKQTIKSGDNITLALDYSGSMEQGNALVKSKFASEKYLSSLDGGKRVRIVAFTDIAQELHDFTTNYENASKSIYTIPDGGGTSIYDTIIESSNNLGKQDGNRILLLMTDGADSSSKYPLEDAIKIANHNNVTVYPIALGGDLNPTVLQQIASETGGQYFNTYEPKELNKIYEDITETTEYIYEIKYLLSAPKKENHKVNLKLTGNRSNSIKFNFKDDRIKK